MADDDYEGVPIGLGMKEPEKEPPKKEPAAPPTPAPSPQITVNVPQPPQQPPQKPPKEKSWFRKEIGAQAVSNANLVGLVAVLFMSMQAYDFFTGFSSIVMRIVFALMTFLLLFFLEAGIGWSVLIAIGDFIVPTLIIGPFIAKAPSAILYLIIPKFIWDFFIGLLPNWPKETQVALTLLFLVLMPSLLFVFGRVKITKDSKSIVYSLAQLVYIATVIYALFFLGAGLADMAGIPAAKTIAQLGTMGPEGQKLASEAGASLIKSPQTISKWFKSVYEQQINIATGGEYYAGQVEQTKNQPVGVYIDSLKPGDPVLYSRQPISVWADLRVVTLADKNVTIKTSCTAEDPVKGKIDGKTDPPEIEIELTGRESVQCKFDSLEHGSVPVNFTAEFGFTTESYINAYFMERDRMVALLNENKNPYDLYPVPTTNPVAVYTNGPVEIGMDLESPIGVSTSSKTPMPILGVTLAPKWKGSISDIESVIVYVPEGIELDKESCDHAFVSTTSTKQGYKAYKLSGTDALRRSLKETTYQTFRCRLKVSDQPKVLQNEKGQQVPLATKYVFVDASYTFALVQQIIINVKESPEEEQERIAAEKAKLAGTLPSSTAPPSPPITPPPSSASPSVVCSTLVNQQSACMSSKESGTNCVYLMENDGGIFRCRKCDANLCCATVDRFAEIPFNVANILSRCNVNCTTVAC